MKRPRISGSRIWWNHELRVLNILKRALERLCLEENLDECEDSLNRRLWRRMNDEKANLPNEEESPWLIMYESRNQPDANDTASALGEKKIPDFQCGYVDTTEEDAQKRQNQYVIECNRVGTLVNTKGGFNRNYVHRGILRFVTADHGYGKSAQSGAMVGYIRSMRSADILSEVNRHATKAKLPSVTLCGNAWIDEGVTRLEQKLDRPKVPPTPFSLRHLWVDLRQK